MTTRNQRRVMKKQANQRPRNLVEVPRDMWPRDNDGDRFKVWLSSGYLVQAFHQADGVIRLSVNRTTLNANGWDDNLSWDELQHIKTECGYGDRVAIEIYPDESNLVNVANIRHLWILQEAPVFMWRKSSV